MFEFLGTSGGIISIISGGLLAAAWVPMVITGMHMALIGIAQVAFLQAGFDPFIFVAINISLWPVFATQIATFLRLKLRDEKSACAGYLVAQLIGGVGEPFIYGMDFRYPKLFLCSMAGSFVSGAIALALGVTAYVAGLPSNLLSMLTFVGGGTENLLFACIAAAVGFAVSFAATWFFGFSKDEIENGPVSERD